MARRQSSVAAISQNPDPYNNLKGFTLHDFDSLTILNKWSRMQLVYTCWRRVNIQFGLRMLAYFVEFCTLGIILSRGCWDRDMGKPDQWERTRCSFSILVWVLGSTFLLLMKFSSERSMRGVEKITKTDVLNFALRLVPLCKLLRYMRVFFHRNRKLQVLGKQFVHGETVTREELAYVISISKAEVGDAQDELNDAFIVDLPMALLQAYYFSNSYNDVLFCNVVDVCRFLLVVIYLINSVRGILDYEEKRKICIQSLHVQSYVASSGRFSVPEWHQGRLVTAVNIVLHATSILAHFLMIHFMGGIHWALGLSCYLFFYAGNLIFTILFSSLSATIQNVTVGIPLLGQNVLDRFVNVFTSKGTSFFELSRQAFLICRREVRIPLILSQLIVYVFTYTSLSGFTAIYGYKMGSSHEDPLMTFSNLQPVQILSNLSSCTSDGFVSQSGFFYDLGEVLMWTSGFLGVNFKSVYELYKIAQLHWIVFYINIMVVVGWNVYTGKHFRYPNGDKFFPVKVSCDYFRVIFDRIFRMNERNAELQLSLLNRLIFLLSLNLETFNGVHSFYNQLGPDDDQIKWWENAIFLELDNMEWEYGFLSLNVLELLGIPLMSEFEEAYNLMGDDPISLRLHLCCVKRLEQILFNDITSSRIQKTLELFSLSSYDIIRSLELADNNR